MIRVVLVDDHAILRAGVRRLLECEPDVKVVGEAEDAHAMLRAVREARPDVVVLDLSLPGESGAELLASVLAAPGRPRAVILSMYPEDGLALRLLKLGASAYLSKGRPPHELVAAVRQAAEGRRYVTDTLAAMALDRPADGALPHERLSPREHEIFLLLVRGRTVSEVAADLDLGSSTVSTHVAAIRDKLGVASNGEIVLYAHRAGLLG